MAGHPLASDLSRSEFRDRRDTLSPLPPGGRGDDLRNDVSVCRPQNKSFALRLPDHESDAWTRGRSTPGTTAVTIRGEIVRQGYGRRHAAKDEVASARRALRLGEKELVGSESANSFVVLDSHVLSPFQ